MHMHYMQFYCIRYLYIVDMHMQLGMHVTVGLCFMKCSQLGKSPNPIFIREHFMTIKRMQLTSLNS